MTDIPLNADVDDQRLRKGTPLHMHLNEQRRGVWNIEAFAAADEIILCSSLFDALAFWNAGYRNVACAFGPDALTDDHLSAFRQFGIRRVLTTCESITSTLTEAGLDCSVDNMPTGMDVCEYALPMDDPAESLGVATQIAEPAPPTNQTAFPAEPKPPTTVADADLQRDEVRMTLGNRRYRIRGLARNLSFDLLQLEELQDQQIKAALEPKSATPTMTREEKEAALELLSDPKLLDRIVSDFDVVGEETNKLLGYLAAVSRRLDDPLAIIVQSSSSAGKTSLMDAILSFVPPEDQVKYSAMSGQSLFYMGDRDLSHKVLAIVEEEGASRATYALKLLQSEGELTIASTGKNTGTSRLVTQEYRVDGPVMIMLATTAIKVDEELLNRCIVLTVNEDRDQTRASHRLQRERETLRGQLADQEWQQTIALPRNAQRMLRPLVVANPHAEALTFLDHKIRARRDHVKYLTLIRTIALLHPYQRSIKTISHKGKSVEYIEVTLDDIEVANCLANDVLGRAVDDLPPQSRVLLDQIDTLVAAGCEQQGVDRCDYRFTRRDIRDHAGCGHTQLGVHLQRLVELEYLLVHRGGRGQQFVYELLHRPPENGDRAMAGLIDVDQLRRNLPGSNGDKPGLEICGLDISDLNVERGTLMIRHGKGSKDRVVPIGDRALACVAKYLVEVRPTLFVDDESGNALFLTHLGKRFRLNQMTDMVRRYVENADIGKRGACHMFRHTMATLMHENGADIRHIQAMLGHAKLDTNQIYTKISIRKLKEIHDKTHPARLERKPDDEGKDDTAAPKSNDAMKDDKDEPKKDDNE